MAKLKSAVVIALALTGGPVLAADLRVGPVKAPALVEPVALTNWNGFYVGVHAGYGWGNMNYRFANDFSIDQFYNNVAGETFNHRIQGALAGGHLGFNWQTGNFVLGLEGSFTWSDIRAHAISPFFPDSDIFVGRINWIATVTPRVGFAAGPALFYAKGGVAFANVTGRVSDLIFNSFDRRRATLTGWTVGGGVEYMLASNWVIGVEGNYYDFGTCCGGFRQSLDIDTGAPAAVGSTHSIRTDMFSVLGRVSYKFGGVPAPVVASY